MSRNLKSSKELSDLPAYELIQEAKESINSINKETKFLSDLADYIIDREY